MNRRGNEPGNVCARAGLAMVVAAVVAGGCGGKQPPPNEPADPKTAVPQTCFHDTWCRFDLAQPPFDDTSKLPLWPQLGCSPIYSFNSGVIIGEGSLCADSPANRQLLHDKHSAFLPGGCTTGPKQTRCLNIPDGMIFVLWHEGAPPPFCPSTCQDISAPTAL